MNPAIEMALQGFQVYLVFQLLLACCYCDAAEGCTVTMEEGGVNREHLVLENITLWCSFTQTNCQSGIDLYWFRCFASHCEEICSNTCINERFKVLPSGKGSRSFTSTKSILSIASLHASDSAIYICGAGGRKDNINSMGHGTTLVVREQEQSIVTTGCAVLIVFCVLLFLYNVAVFSIYAYRSKLKIFKEPKTEEKEDGSKNKSYRRQRIFQAIAQEYHKRYPRKSINPNSVDDAIYQNT
ncbi:hypothetical protein XENTR_v10024023 [Xenopus tropicalis]|nr:immunoglobulin superfamily member 6 [Xenopus tropicalis]KAE8579379.1 hypothetical protein XENTR_v10024023 [Xenopus tropicalis]|eukprot:XP_004918042.1 PREDICTED: immunoglobulin superfamily member 6 [Xenopus tropicalis]